MWVDKEEWDDLKSDVRWVQRDNERVMRLLLMSGVVSRTDHGIKTEANVAQLKQDFQRLLDHFGLEFVDVPEKRELRIKEN